MKTKAVRIYGVNDLRLEEFELPEMGEDEILMKVVSDSICMSTYKAALQGAAHKRVPNDVAENPTIVGHEFCGELVKVGKMWENQFHVGQKVSIQPALNDPEDIYAAPGYSFRYIGGDATYVIVPRKVMELGCLLNYTGDAFYYGSLSEPMACIAGGFHTAWHNIPGHHYAHKMDIKQNGKMAILAGAGPMGLGAIDYAIHRDIHPSLLVVTDVDDARLQRAASIYTPEDAKKFGVELHYVNTACDNPVEVLRGLTGGTGFDDVFVFAPVKAVVEQGGAILGHDGCLNFFAGPTKTEFSAEFNFYNVHYDTTHIAGDSGSNIDDVVEVISMMGSGKVNPSSMITHVGGLDAVVDTTLNLPNIKGGKKLIYTQISLPLFAIDDLEKMGETDPMYAELARITKANNGLWCKEAEDYLLSHAKAI
ncbi:MAG: zinc-binding dehydrogenase [Acutalibacteraceae bacterium]